MSVGQKATVDVSVVIPYFNSETVIARALRSIANQTVLPREVFVVDDCSSSGSAGLLAQVVLQFDSLPLQLVRLPSNVGAGSARNVGWNASRGKYIAFLDSDDSWHPSKLEIQARYLDANEGTTLCAHAHEVSGETDSWPIIEKMQVVSVAVSAQMLLMKNRFITPSVMVLRDIPLRFEDGQRHMEDHLLWTRIAMAGGQIDYLPVVMARIHKQAVGEKGLSNQLIAMQLADTRNYWKLRSSGQLGLPMTIVYTAYSLAKFVRRLALIAIWRIRRMLGIK